MWSKLSSMECIVSIELIKFYGVYSEYRVN